MNFVDATLLEGKRNPTASLLGPDLAEGRGKCQRDKQQTPDSVHRR